MVGSLTNKNTFAVTSASSTAIPLSFRYDDATWVTAVAYASAGDSLITLQQGVDYILSGDGTAIDGDLTLQSVFLSSIPASGYTLIVYRIAPALQTLDLTYNGRLPSEAVEKALDWLAMASIDRSGILQNALTFPLSDPAGFSYEAPPANERKGKVLTGSIESGSLDWLSFRNLGYQILPFFGGAPTSDDVIAAISALSPIYLDAPPTNSTPGKFGQLAITPGSFRLIPEQEDPFSPSPPFDTEILNDFLGSPLLEAGEVNWDGYPGPSGGKVFKNYSVSGIDPYSLSAPADDLWVRTVYSISDERIYWKIGGFLNGTSWGGWSQVGDETPDSPWQVTEWSNDISFLTSEPITDGDISLNVISPQIWVNTSRGIVPQWKRILTLEDLSPSSLPAVDPERRGQPFLDGTVLNISLGPI